MKSPLEVSKHSFILSLIHVLILSAKIYINITIINVGDEAMNFFAPHLPTSLLSNC